MTRMICKNCGFEADDYIFCVKCGTKMAELEQLDSDEGSSLDAQDDQLEMPEPWTDQWQGTAYHNDQNQWTEAQVDQLHVWGAQDQEPAAWGAQDQEPAAWGGQDQEPGAWGELGDTTSFQIPVDAQTPLSPTIKSNAPSKSAIAIGATAAIATIALIAAIFILGNPFPHPSNIPPQTSVTPPSQSPSSGSGNGTSSGQTTQNPQSGGTSGTSTNDVPSPTSSTQNNSPSTQSQPSQPNSGNSQNSSASATNAEEPVGTAHAGQQQTPQGQQGQQSQESQQTPQGQQSQQQNQQTSQQNKQGQPSSGSSNSSGSNQEGQVKLVAQSNTTPSREYAGESSDIGNLANGGQLASSGSDIYYAKPEDGKEWVTKSIVRTQADGKKKDEIYKASSDTKSIDNINALKDRLVFTETVKDKTYVVSVDSKGGDKRLIDESDKGALCQVYDGWVYYQHDGNVYRCDPFGQGQSEIRKVGDDQWYVIDNMIFTIEDDSTTIYLNVIGSSERVKIHTASDGCYIASVCFKSAHILPILEKSKTSKKCSVIEVTGNGGPIPRWVGEGDVEALSSYDDGIVLLRKNAANDYSIFTLRGPDADSPKDRTREWDGELKAVGDVKNKGEVRYMSSFSGSIAFASVNNNSKCGWNAIPNSGGDIRAI